MADVETNDDHHGHACGHGHAAASDPLPAGSPEKVIDPVCGMTVNPVTSKHRFDHAGRTFHFCGARCREKFAADPDQYLTSEANRPSRRRKAPSTPARCIRRSARKAPEAVRSAAWRWNL